MSGSPLLQIGYVARAHGLKGEVVIKTFDPTSTALDEVERVCIVARTGESRDFEISSVGESPGSDLLVRLGGISRREDADALRGGAVHVYRDDLEQPEEGEYFHGDLVGLKAVTPEGRPLGTVEEIWSTGPVPNLCIRNGKEELLVPFAEDFVPKVDLAGGTLTVIPPEYEEA